MIQLFTYKDLLPSNRVKPDLLTGSFGRKIITD